MSERVFIGNCMKDHEINPPIGYGDGVVELPFNCPTVKESVAVTFRIEAEKIVRVSCMKPQKNCGLVNAR